MYYLTINLNGKTKKKLILQFLTKIYKYTNINVKYSNIYFIYLF